MNAISIISVCIAIASLVYTAFREIRHNAKEDTSGMTTVIVKLESIKDTVAEIKTGMEDLKREVRSDHDLLIKVDQSLKAAWRTIDEIQAKKATDERT